MRLIAFIQAFAVIFILTFTSCVKEGPMGPAGPQGETGGLGPQGETGPPGTALEHSEFLFDDVTVPVSPGTAQRVIAVPKEEFEKSIMLIYVRRGVNWLQIPGGGASNINTYRYYTNFYNDDETTVTISRVTGPGPETFQQVRIIIIPL